MQGSLLSEVPYHGHKQQQTTVECSQERYLRLCPRKSQRVNDLQWRVSFLQLSSAWKWFFSCHKPALPIHPFLLPCYTSETVKIRAQSIDLFSQREEVYPGK